MLLGPLPKSDQFDFQSQPRIFCPEHFAPLPKLNSHLSRSENTCIIVESICIHPTLMAPKPKSIEYALSQFAQHGDAPLRVHFPDITVTKPGANVTRATAARQPTLSVSSTMVKVDLAKKYIAIMLDLDAPYPSLPIMGPIAHAIQANLQLSAKGQSTGWLKLEPMEKPILPYLAPAPPPMSALHRYLIMLWEQPEGWVTEDVKSELKLAAQPGMMARVKWDEEGFEKKLSLGTVLAGTLFVC